MLADTDSILELLKIKKKWEEKKKNILTYYQRLPVQYEGVGKISFNNATDYMEETV